MPDLICHKTEFIDRTISYSVSFDPDDPTLMDRYPRYDMDKTPWWQTTDSDTTTRGSLYTKGKQKDRARRLKSNLSAIPDEGKPNVKHK